jgi:PilZ domain
VPTFPVPEGRRSKRIPTKQRASLVVNLDRNPKRLPCLVVDSSKEGFRLRGSFHLRRGQIVEVVPEDSLNAVRCSVVWIGKAGSKQEGEIGVEIVLKQKGAQHHGPLDLR